MRKLKSKLTTDSVVTDCLMSCSRCCFVWFPLRLYQQRQSVRGEKVVTVKQQCDSVSDLAGSRVSWFWMHEHPTNTVLFWSLHVQNLIQKWGISPLLQWTSWLIGGSITRLWTFLVQETNSGVWKQLHCSQCDWLSNPEHVVVSSVQCELIVYLCDFSWQSVRVCIA